MPTADRDHTDLLALLYLTEICRRRVEYQSSATKNTVKLLNTDTIRELGWTVKKLSCRCVSYDFLLVICSN